MNVFENVSIPKLQQAFFDSLAMLFISGLFIFVLGLFLGVILYLTDNDGLMENTIVNKIISTLINVLRSIPFIVLLVVLMPVTKLLTGRVIGFEAAIPALVVSMAPFFARIIHLALNEVSSGVIEAAKSMGASKWQIVTKFLFPEAKPAIISGVTIAAVTLLANTAVAGVTVGAGGLGQLAIDSFNNTLPNQMWVATLLLTVIVFALQIPGDYFTHLVDKR